MSPTAVATTGNPSERGLEQDERQRLAARGDHQRVGGAQQIGNVGTRAEQAHRAPMPQPRDPRAELGLERALAGDQQARARIRCSDARERIEQVLGVLVGMQAARAQEDEARAQLELGAHARSRAGAAAGSGTPLGM